MVFATAPRGSKRAKPFRQIPQHPLPPDLYLIKIYFDGQEKTTKDRDYELGEKEFIGQVEINGDWPVGYCPPMIVHAPK